MSGKSNQEVVAQLEPAKVWEFFARLSEVPRPSKHEDKVQAFIEQLADELNLPHRKDAAGNIVIDVPPSPGREKSPVVVLQAHLDMVAEKNSDVQHDFLKDPIRLAVDKDKRTGREIVRAEGTTLGADNGIGVAMALAAAFDPQLEHGPLELLLTSDEETGLTGANALTPGSVKGRILLNLDSEEDDALYIGCAGGADIAINWKLTREQVPADLKFFRIDVAGLKGGHSGCDIHLNRGNAIKILARVLASVLDDNLHLAEITGGSKRNAIPREASAVIACNAEAGPVLEQAAETIKQQVIRNNGEEDCRITVQASPVAGNAAAGSQASVSFVRGLMALPSGVLAIVPEIPGFVQTSSNLSTIKSRSENNTIEITAGCHSRSSSGDDLEITAQQVCAAATLSGAACEVSNQYPGWKPNPDSTVLKTCSRVYNSVFGHEPKIAAIHAGLECGIIGERVGGMDMVSFGPDIDGAHSPDERVYVESVQKMYRFLAAVLKELAGS